MEKKRAQPRTSGEMGTSKDEAVDPGDTRKCPIQIFLMGSALSEGGGVAAGSEVVSRVAC